MTLVVASRLAPKGWKDDPRFVYVGRSRGGRVTPGVGSVGYFGNPYKVEDHGLEECLDLFRDYAEAKVLADPDYREAVRGLAEKTLVCYCAPKGGVTKNHERVCHGQVLAEIAERLAKENP